MTERNCSRSALASPPTNCPAWTTSALESVTLLLTNAASDGANARSTSASNASELGLVVYMLPLAKPEIVKAVSGDSENDSALTSWPGTLKNQTSAPAPPYSCPVV